MTIRKVLTKLRSFYDGYTTLGSFTDKTPFQVLIATVLSARSKDSQTIRVIKDLFAFYPDAPSLSRASISHLEEIVKKTGFYRVKARRIKEIATILAERDVPDDMDSLIALPGVGRKTAGCVLVYAFKKPAIPVDTHVHRISNRLGWVRTSGPEETESELMRIVPKDLWIMLNEVLVLHGQNICSPIRPKCSKCPVLHECKKIGV